MRLGLEPIKRAQQQLYRSALDLIAISPTLWQRPNDWPDKVHIPGFLNQPPPSRPEKLEPDLREFLARGPAPVYVCFEDMSSIERNPHTLIELAVEALEAAGCRAIVQSELPRIASPNVFRVSALAQDQVLPRCSAMIHHGGAETTQAALRFGLPSIVIAHLAANFQWGRRLYKLGVAPRHLHRGDVDTRHLTRAIERVTRNPAMRATAERLSEEMRKEDGVRRAVDLIAGIGANPTNPYKPTNTPTCTRGD
jgi:sterol 3beta-glucosyltransferase